MLAGVSTFSAQAIIAKPGVLNVEQPDGTELRVILTGDHRNHYATTEDGYLLCERDGYYFYATLNNAGIVENSGRRAHNAETRSAADRSFLATVNAPAVVEARRAAMSTQAASRFNAKAGPGLFPGTAFPSMGEQKALVILVEYTDVKFRTDYDAHDYFTRMLNEKGFSDYDGTGSCRDFFVEASMGQFVPQFDLYGPVTLANNQSYYGGNDYSGNDRAPEEMVIEACELLDDEIDFSQYDRDGDGYVDNVYIFYAGRGEADGGSSSTVWPHSWDLSSAGYDGVRQDFIMHDGVIISRYGCSNERDAYRPDGIGTFCHEFSHVMGLPDLYATSYTGAFTPGSWSALDSGPYNNDGCTPPTYSAFERYALGWLEPIVLDGRADCSLPHIMTSNKAYIIPTEDENEFFLLENRQQVGSDAFIPGHGMLIWHVDYNDNVWTKNTVNNSASHQYVDIEEADGTQTEASRPGDAFPGTKNVTTFTDETSPSMRTWLGKKLNMPITDIAENDGIITFKVKGGLIDIPAPVLSSDATALTINGFTVEWSTVELATNYRVNLQREDNAGSRIDVDGYSKFKVEHGTKFAFAGLEPSTTYYVTVYAENDGCLSPASNEIAVTTLTPTLGNLQVTLNPVTSITPTGATLSWRPLEDADEYIVDVYSRTIADAQSDGCDFTGGIAAMPQGWTTDSKSTYGNSQFAGDDAPALKLSSNGNYVMTPLYDDDIHEFSFWARGASSAANNSIRVSALIDGVWSTIGDYDIVNTKGGNTYTLYNITPLTHQMKIEFVKEGSGYLAIDDISLIHGGEIKREPVGDYSDYSAGNATSLTLTGLTPATRYFYTVYARNTEYTSIKSIEESFVTEPSSGIDGITQPGDTVTVSVDGLNVYVNAPLATGITVTDVTGRTVCHETATATTTTLRIPAPGLYIVKAGRAVVKIAVR